MSLLGVVVAAELVEVLAELVEELVAELVEGLVAVLLVLLEIVLVVAFEGGLVGLLVVVLVGVGAEEAVAGLVVQCLEAAAGAGVADWRGAVLEAELATR